MKLSIYRQRAPRSELDHGACIRGATTEADVDLVGLALDTDKPTLIGLDGQNTIIKTVAEGDDALTFEDLYDTCLTLGDLRNMKRAGVKSPDEVPSSRFRVALTFRLACDIDVALELTAANHGDVRKQLRDLIDGDASAVGRTKRLEP